MVSSRDFGDQCVYFVGVRVGSSLGLSSSDLALWSVQAGGTAAEVPVTLIVAASHNLTRKCFSAKLGISKGILTYDPSVLGRPKRHS